MCAKRAFVTGATGFLGMNLVEELLERSWQVVAVHRPSSKVAKLDALGVKLVIGDLTDPTSLEAAIPEAVEAVFHVAGNTSMWALEAEQQYRDNVVGTRHLAAAALARGVGRFVYTSSVAVHGFPDATVSEDSPHLGETSWLSYFRSKALAEREVHAAVERGLDAVILNPANIIGPHDYHNWSRMVAMIHDDSLPGIPPGSGSFCHSRAVAKAHVAAFEKGLCSRNYLLGGVDATFLEVARIVARELGAKVPTHSSPAILLKAAGRFAYWWSLFSRKEPEITPEVAAMVCSDIICSSDRAMTELDYEPISLDEMIRDCIGWMRDEGLLPPAL